jgi:hypothetical protein
MVAIAIGLVLLDAGAGGVVMAYICFHTILSILLYFSLTKIFGYYIIHKRSNNNKRQSSFNDTTRNILRASLPS